MAVRLRRRRPHDPDGTMTVFEHLGELRRRLIICVAALMIGAVVGWFLFGPVFRLLTDGYCAYIKAHPNLSPVRGQCRLAYLSILEPFLLKVKLVTFIGFAFALPVILFQLWRFVTPGLTTRESRGRPAGRRALSDCCRTCWRRRTWRSCAAWT